MSDPIIDLKNLPNDVDQLHKIIRDSSMQTESIQQILLEKNTIIDHQKTELQILRHKLHQQLLARFAAKSEKLPNQPGLFDEAESVSDEAQQTIESADQAITVASYQRKSGRKALPKHLPRERIIHDLSDAKKICDCGCALQSIGEDRREQLEWIPAQVKVIEHIRLKYACKQCEYVKAATMPSTPIPKSIATPGLLAEIIVNKYVDHQPLYRQEKKLQRFGVDIVRSTLSSWIIKTANLLAPLALALKQHILSGHYIQADETTQQVLNEVGRARQAKSYLWVFKGGPKKQHGVIYHYSPSRSGEVAEHFLGNFTGALQCDGFSGYHRFQDKTHIHVYLCWAHARRKFADIVKANKKKRGKAHEVLDYIAKLYAIEKIAREKELSFEQRHLLRQEQSRPILEALKKWLDATQTSVPPSFPIGQAISYTLKHWTYLITYVDNAEVEIDNNLVENMIRPFALGRKNWLFHNSVAGAEASAIIYSLMQTCKIHQVESYAYFKYVIAHIKQWPEEDYQSLLPMFIDQEKIIQGYTENFITTQDTS